jgi:hypothetical protein
MEYGKSMKSRELNRSSKLKIYRSLIRPVVTYGCEACTLANRDEQHLIIFERRILRKIFGPIQNEDGSWRILEEEVDCRYRRRYANNGNKTVEKVI